MQKFIDRVTATADPPNPGVHNPIHDAQGADAAGYAGALVAGVRTYGWAAHTLTRALGDAWLEQGWVDFQLLRPLYAGETLRSEVAADSPLDDSVHSLVCVAEGEADERVVLDGTAGIGAAPWLAELNVPDPAPAQGRADVLPGYDLDSIPLQQPLRPLGVYVSGQAARNMVVQDLALSSARYLSPQVDTSAFIHPYFLAGRVAPLTRHNFTYGPTIHVRSQIQHLREPVSDRQITVGAQIVEAYERNDHWYQVLDALVSDDQGDLAKIRHHTIFRPRGT